jgi:hypothetical protein
MGEGRRTIIFKSEGLDYDVKAKIKALYGLPGAEARSLIRHYRAGICADAGARLPAIERLVIEAKRKAKRAAATLDILRAVARDFRQQTGIGNSEEQDDDSSTAG